ncbi:MAG: YkvA family protein [Chloroflexia bacterium]
MTFWQSWKNKAKELKTEVYALYLAYRDPRVPWPARIFAGFVVAYAFSPIDLIPDPIPILGYLDDLILIPIGVALARRMIPPTVLAECRSKAKEAMQSGKPVNWVAAGVIIAIWLILAVLTTLWLIRVFSP